MDIHSTSLNFVLFTPLGIFLILVGICKSAYRQNSGCYSPSDGSSSFLPFITTQSFFPSSRHGLNVGQWWVVVVVAVQGVGELEPVFPFPPYHFVSLSAVKSIFRPLSSSQNSHSPSLFGLTIPFLQIPYLAGAGGRRLFVEVGCSFKMQVNFKAFCVFSLCQQQHLIDLLIEH